MAPQVVYKNEFQGNTYVIYCWHAKHYAFGCIAPNGEEIWSGIAQSMFMALGAIFDELGKIADQIDEGNILPQGPFLDPSGKEIPQ